MKAIVVIVVFMSGLIILFTSCNDLFSDERFSMSKTNYIGHEIKTEGYFYSQDINYERTTVKIFYRNGIFLSTNSYSTYNLDIVEKELLSQIEMIKDDKMNWGLFEVSDSSLTTEEYIDNPPSSKLITMKSFYEIKNDTTIILKRINHPGYKKETYNEQFHFKQFSPKPDSTNVYIK